MIDKLRQLWDRWSEKGLKLPFMHDPVEGKSSITIFFPYATFALSVISLIALHFRASLVIATWTSIGVWVISMILYMIRKIQKAKINLESKSIDIESDDDQA